MKHLCLTLPEQPERHERVKAHLAEHGINDVHFVMGVDAVKAGLTNTHPYLMDNPSENFIMGPKPTGMFLGHYLCWTVCDALPDEHFLIFEDDVQLCHDWQEKLKHVLEITPKDVDILFLGSCCVEGHQGKRHIKDNVWKVKQAQCLHAYMVSKKAVKYLIGTQRDWYGLVDCLMVLHSFPYLNVYATLPRMADQLNTELPA